MNINILNLLFPQWQGSGDTNDLYHGANKIKGYFQNNIDFFEVPIALNTSTKFRNGIYAYDAIVEQLNNAKNIIKKENPEKILTIGGDCGVELAPVSFLNNKYADDLAVIWFDAHGDLNTPEESTSHHFHGMPLRSLLGDGDEKITTHCFSNISAKQVILAGGRDYDPSEKKYIQENKIETCTVSQLSGEGGKLSKFIQSGGYKNLYIHIDLDVLDPKQFPFVKCPTKGGISIETLIKIIFILNHNFNIVGFSIVEFSPFKDFGLKDIESLLKAGDYLQ